MLSIDSENDLPALRYFPNLVYSRQTLTKLRLHLMVPVRASSSGNTRSEPRPLIVFIPGCRWRTQNLFIVAPRMIQFAQQSGYAVAMVAHRSSRQAKAPAQLVDVKAALRYLREHADQYDIDPARIGIWGDSSGGHLAALAACTPNVEEFSVGEFRDQSESVQAVAVFYAPTDFSQMHKFPSAIDHDAANSPESIVIGASIRDPQNYQRVQAYNPIHYIDPERNIPPFLIVHGDRDEQVPFNQSVLLYKALKRENREVILYKIKGAGHGSKCWTPRVMRIVEDFFNRNL